MIWWPLLLAQMSNPAVQARQQVYVPPDTVQVRYMAARLDSLVHALQARAKARRPWLWRRPVPRARRAP